MTSALLIHGNCEQTEYFSDKYPSLSNSHWFPWLDPKRIKTTDFFDFTIDPKLSERVAEIHLLVSDNDDEDIHTSVKEIRDKLPQIKLHEFRNLGHFTYEEMKTAEFPELLNLITSSE